MFDASGGYVPVVQFFVIKKGVFSAPFFSESDVLYKLYKVRGAVDAADHCTPLFETSKKNLVLMLQVIAMVLVAIKALNWVFGSDLWLFLSSFQPPDVAVF